MKKQRLAIWIVGGLLAILLAGALILVLSQPKKEEAAVGEQINLELLSAYTNEQIYADVPALQGESVKYGVAADYGKKNWVLDVNGVTLEEYKAYLVTLEQAGFVKHSENSEDAVDGYIKTAAFKKDDLTFTVSYVVQGEKVYLAATKGLELSEYLINKPEYVASAKEGAKTTLHMLQLNDNGSSFVIQLKNGHFVVHDGGKASDAPYLLDYLEELTEGNEKPIIEAWFISHAHGDHVDALNAIATNPEYSKRLIVDGIYFNEPNSKVATNLKYTEAGSSLTASVANNSFTSQTGETAKFYRPQLGQRYYFCDITIDVCMTQEQIAEKDYYSADYNDTSTWFMHNIGEQRFLFGGDANITGIRKITFMYDESYFDVDVFSVLHHGINVYDFFTDFCTVKTALYTSFRMGSIWTDGTWREAANENVYLQESVAEAYHHGNGTVVLTFPYKVGEAKIQEPCDWRYNVPKGQPDRSSRWTGEQ